MHKKQCRTLTIEKLPFIMMQRELLSVSMSCYKWGRGQKLASAEGDEKPALIYSSKAPEGLELQCASLPSETTLEQGSLGCRKAIS